MVAIVTGASLGLGRTSVAELGSAGELGPEGQAGNSPNVGLFGENVYVNAANGNLIIERTDEYLAGVGLNDDLTTVYNSLAQTSAYGAMGNWQTNDGISVGTLNGTYGATGSYVNVTGGDGTIYTYTWNGTVNDPNTGDTGAYVCTQASNAANRLTLTGNNWSLWYGETGVTDTFSNIHGGRITKSEDANSNSLTYAYNSSGYLSTVTSSDGEYTLLTYTGADLTNVTTYYYANAAAQAAGTYSTLSDVNYTYDSLNRLSTVTTQTLVSNSVTITYGYTDTSNPNLVTSISQTGGEQLNIGYTLVGSNYCVTSLTQTLSSGVTSTTSFSYGTNTTTITDNAGNQTVLTYDGLGQLLSVQSPPAQSGASAETTTYTYNSDGDVATATNALGTTQYFYDNNDNLTEVIDPLGNTTTYTYDPSNHMLTATTTPYGSSTSSTIRYAYDSNENLEFIVADDGQVTQYTHNARGQLISAATYPNDTYNLSGLTPGVSIASSTLLSWASGLSDLALSNLTKYTYDYRGNLASTTTFSALNSTGTSGATGALKTIVDYIYDQSGNLLSKMTSDGTGVAYGSTYTYDGLNRVISTTSQDGNSSTITYNDSSDTTTVTLGDGLTTVDTYNLAGQLISSVQSGADTATATTTYQYDSLGNLCAVTDPNGNTTYFLYDNLDRKVATIAADGSMTRTIYTQANQVAATVVYADRLTTSQMDSIEATNSSGELDDPALSTVLPTSSSSDIWNWRIYDSDNRLIETINGDGDATVYAYATSSNVVSTTAYVNALSATTISDFKPTVPAISSNLISTTVYANALSASTISSFKTTPPTTLQLPTADPGVDETTRNFYNNEGQLIGTLNAQGYLTENTYNNSGQLIQTTQSATQASSSLWASGTFSQLLTSVGTTSSDRTTMYFYDGRGLMLFSVNANLVPTEYVYDSAGNLTETIRFAGSITASSSGYTLSYVQGQVTTAPLSTDANETTWYVYDTTTGNLDFKIDAMGDVTEYFYNTLGQVTQTTQFATLDVRTALPALSTMQSWASSHTTGNTTTSSVYNIAGQLVYTINAMGSVTQYQYDADGHVIQETQFAALDPVTASPAESTMDSWASSNSSNTQNRIFLNVYNQDGQLVYKITPTDDTGGDYYSTVTQYTYSAAGQLTSQIVYPTQYQVSAGATVASMAAMLPSSPPSTAEVTSYSYDAAGRVTDTFNALGIDTHVVYDAFGRVTSSTVAYGTSQAATTTYTYDIENRLLTESVAPGDSEATATTTYTYDGFGRVLSVTDPNGYATSYTYDDLGNVLTTTDGTGAVTTNTYDAFGNVLTKTDALGNETYYFYDALNRLTLEVDPLGYATATTYTVLSQIASVTRYVTPVTGTITPGIAPTVTADPGSDATTSFTYNVLGQVTKETDAAGYYESYTYDAFGDQLTVRNKLGGTTDYTYDNRGLVLTEVLPEDPYISGPVWEATSVTNTYSYDAFGNRTQMVEASGLIEQSTTNYTYDVLNRLIQVTGDPVTVTNPTTLATTTGVVPTTTYVYDDRNNLIETINPAGAETFYYYDLLNRKIAEVNAVGDLSEWAYDADGNVVTATVYGTAIALPTSPGGAPPTAVNPTVNQQTTYTYDHDDRLLTATIANVLTGSYSLTGYSGPVYTTATGNITSTNVYNADGDLVQATDGNGNSTYYYYDADGRKIAELDPDTYLTTYVLDPFGNVLTEQQYATQLTSTPPTTASTLAAIDSYATSSSNDRITTFTYDLDNNMLTETRENVAASTVNATTGALTTATANSTTTYTYNGFGQVLTVTQATGDETTYTYGATGWLLSQTQSAFNNYNNVSVIDQTNYEYNGLNELTRVQQKDAGTGATMPTRYTFYTYGADGWLATMEDPTGFTRTYGHNIAGQVVSVSYSNEQSNKTTYVTEADVYQYDALGRQILQTTASESGSTWTFDDEYQTQYNAYGEVSAQQVNGVTTQSYSYDNAGRLWSETNSDGATELFLYDADGNQTLSIGSSGLTLPSGYGWSTLTLAQAINILTNDGANAIGATNPTSSGMDITFTTYDARDMALETFQPFSEMSPNGSGGYNTQTLANSNTYDAFGDVVQSTDAEGNVTNYTYSTLGDVTEEQQPGTIDTYYYYDISGRQVGTTDPDGNTTTETLLANTGYNGSAALVLSQFDPNGSVATNGYDVFGELAQSTNGDGDVTTYSYDEDGRLIQQNNPTVAPDSPGNPSSSAVQLINYYLYDGLGLKIDSWNNELGSAHETTTDYDAQGRIIASTDQDGNTTTYTYNDSANTTTTTLGNGLTTVDTYNLANQLVSSVQSGADTVTATYLYDSRGNLCEVTDPNGDTTYYLYDNLNRKVATIAADGSITEYIYTADSQVAAIVVYANRLSSAQIADLTSDGQPVDPALTTILPASSSSDIWNWNIYDDDNRLIETINGDGDATVYSYDAASNLVSTTAYANALSASTISSFKTTAPTTLQLPTADPGVDQVTRSFYNNEGQVVGTLNGDGYLTENFYNNSGQLTQTTQFATQANSSYWASGTLSQLLTSVGTSSSDQTTRYFYDDRGLMVYSLNAALVPTEYDYDDAGNLVDTIQYYEPIDATTTYTNSYVQGQVAGMAGNAANRTTWNIYDTTTGNLDFQINAAGAVTAYTYNALGQVTQTTQYATLDPQTSLPTLSAMQSWATSNDSNTQNQVTSNVYNIAGQLAYSIDAVGDVTKYVYDADGHVIQTTRFATLDPVTSCPTEATMDSWATTNGSNTSNRTTYSVYNADGQLAYTIDPVGDVTGYIYNTAGQVITETKFATTDAVTSPPSYATMSSWAAANGTSQDRIVQNVYDGAGRLVYTLTPTNTQTVGSTLEYYYAVTNYTYNAAGQLASQNVYGTTYYEVSSTVPIASGITPAQVQSMLTATPPSSTETTSYTYDAAGRLTDTTNAMSIDTHVTYNAFGDMLTSTVAYGTSQAAETTYTYDLENRLLTQSTAPGDGEATATTTYTYDAFGDVLTAEDPNLKTTTYTYNALGEVLKTTDPASGNNIVNTYDAFGNVLTTTDANGNLTYFFYDGLNRLVLEIDPVANVAGTNYGYATATTYTIGGEIATVKQYESLISTGSVTAGLLSSVSLSGSIATTTFTRDDLGRVTEETDPAGFYESYTYDAFGDQLTVRNKAGGTIDYTYDNRGLMLSEVLPETDYENSTTVGTTVTNLYSYDAYGNRTQMIQAYTAAGTYADQLTTNYTYDLLNRLSKVTGNPVQVMNTSTLTSSSVTPTTTYTYDDRGNLIEEAVDQTTSDPAGIQTFYYYDNLNRNIAEINPLGTLTTWAYDADGNVATQNIYATAVSLPTTPGGTPPAGSGAARTTTYTYDADNRLLTTTIDDVETGSYSSSTYTTTSATSNITTLTNVYDANGNLIETTDANGNNTYYYYNADNQQIAEVDPDGYLTTYSFEFNPGSGNVTVYGRDFNGNALTETQYALPVTGAGTTSSVSGLVGQYTTEPEQANAIVTVYTYDNDGDRLSVTRDNVASWSVSSTGVLTPNTQTTSEITYTYNGLGEVLTATQQTGDETTYTYDGMGRQIVVKTSSFTNWDGATVQAETKSYYDGENNLTRTVLQDVDASMAVRTANYTYVDGRLTTMTDPTGFVHNYGYNVAGQVVSQNYLLAQPVGSAINTAQIYGYNALGQQVTQSEGTESGSTWTFGEAYETQYDAFGDVVAQQVNGITEETDSYNNAGWLVASTASNGSEDFYLYDKDGNQTLEITPSGDALPTGYSWSTLTAAQALGLVSSASTVGATDPTTSGFILTYTAYDKKSQALETIEPYRELSAGSSSVTLTSSKTYDAFGDVASTTDANGNTTTFAYDLAQGSGDDITYLYSLGGQALTMTQPSVTYIAWTEVSVDGVDQLEPETETGNPVTQYFYDISGRQVGTTDPNGNTTTQTLLANTGYNGTSALVLQTFNPVVGSVTSNLYDVYGELAESIDADGDVTTYTYDEDGRLLSETLPARPADSPGNDTGTAIQLTENYVYDGLGQRIETWNSELGSSDKATTTYDDEGRVTKSVDLDGNATTYGYVWSSSVVDAEGATTGGWVETTTDPDDLTQTQTTDVFGNMISLVDELVPDGGTSYTYAYAYDSAGRLIEEVFPDAAPGGDGSPATTDDETITYFNTGMVATETDYYHQQVKHKVGEDSGSTIYWNTYNLASTYSYDGNGNELTETLNANSTLGEDDNYTANSYENATSTYDALNRMTKLTDTGYDGSAPVTLTWAYDRDSNVINQTSTYHGISNAGAVQTGTLSQNYWYTYDSMNDITTDDGILSGVTTGYLELGAAGTDYAYDAAGRRVQSISTVVTPDGTENYYQEQEETYTYTPDGYLAQTAIATGARSAASSGYVTPPAVGTSDFAASGALTATYDLDAMGRVTGTVENVATPTGHAQTVYSKTATYDADSNVLTDSMTTLRSNGTTYAQSDIYSYAWSTGGYEGPEASTVTTTTGEVGGSTTTSETQNAYGWMDGNFQLESIVYTPNTSSPGTTYTTTMDFNVFQQLDEASVWGGTYFENSYVENFDGEILSNFSSVDPASLYYFFGNTQEGEVTNNGSTNVTYAQSVTNQTLVPGSGYFQDGAATGTPYAAFGTDITNINAQNANQSSPTYTVQSGDSLESIAQMLWGNSSYWYLLADANGIEGDSQLYVGETLNVPTLANNNQNTASTNTVYNATQAEGNISPTHPPPSHSSGCGIIGEIILAVVAVVAAYFTFGASLSLLGADSVATATLPELLAAGAMAGAAGSVASQLVGVATGIQSSFNWAAVGEAALGGAVSGGLQASGLLGALSPLGTFAASAIYGAVGDAATQGIEIATGLQKKFNWVEVAASGVGSGVAAEAEYAFSGPASGSNTSSSNAAGNNPAVTAATTDEEITVTTAPGYALPAPLTIGVPVSSPTLLSEIVGGTAGLISYAATQSAFGEGSFGQDLENGLPDTVSNFASDALQNHETPQDNGVGQTSGNAIANGDNQTFQYTSSQIQPADLSNVNLGPQTLTFPNLFVNPDGSVDTQGSVTVTLPASTGDNYTPPSGIEEVVITAPKMTQEQDVEFDFNYFNWWKGVSSADLAPVSNTGILPYVLSPAGRLVGAFDSTLGSGISALENGIGNAVENPIGTAQAILHFVDVGATPAQLWNGAKAGVMGVVNNFNAAVQNGTVPEFVGSGLANVVMFGATVATDTEELDGVDAAAVAKLGDSISITGTTTSALANAPFLARGGWEYGPYLEGSTVQQFTTNESLNFVRFTTNNPEGQWLAMESDVAGMTPEQIQQHLALPEIPTSMLSVSVPADTEMQLGIAGPQPNFLSAPGGAVQYQLMHYLPSEYFGPMRPIAW